MELNYKGYKRYVRLGEILGKSKQDHAYSKLQEFIDSLCLDNLKVRANGRETFYLKGNTCLFKEDGVFLIFSHQEINEALRFDFLIDPVDINKLIIYLFKKHIKDNNYNLRNTYISSNLNYLEFTTRHGI